MIDKSVLSNSQKGKTSFDKKEIDISNEKIRKKLYVSNSDPHADDNYTYEQNSIERPWKTIERVNSETQIKAGDAIHFACEDEFYGRLKINFLEEKENFLTITSYILPNTSPSASNPIIGFDLKLENENWKQFQDGNTWYLDMNGEVIAKDIDIGSIIDKMVLQESDNEGNLKWLIKRDKLDEIKNYSGTFFYDKEKKRLYINKRTDKKPIENTFYLSYEKTKDECIHGISIVGQSDNNKIGYIDIKNLTIVGCDFGVYLKYTRFINLTNCVIKGARVGIVAGEVNSTETIMKNLKVENCELEYVGSGVSNGHSENLIYIKNKIIMDAHFYDRDIGDGVGSVDLEGFGFLECKNVRVQFNSIKEGLIDEDDSCVGTGIATFPIKNGVMKNLDISYNVIDGVSKGISIYKGYANGKYEQAKFRWNEVYNVSGFALWLLGEGKSEDSSDLVIEYNLFKPLASSSYAITYQDNPINFTVRYNLVYKQKEESNSYSYFVDERCLYKFYGNSSIRDSNCYIGDSKWRYKLDSYSDFQEYQNVSGEVNSCHRIDEGALKFLHQSNYINLNN